MASDRVQPYTGSLSIDLQHLDGIIIDIAEGATRGWRREKENIDDALTELTGSIPIHGATIGVSQDILPRIQTRTEQLASVREARLSVAKQLEVLEETEIFLEDQREADIGVVVSAARRVGARNAGVLVHFEKTMRYHGQIGTRAAKTRKKAVEQAKVALAAQAVKAQLPSPEARAD